MSAAAMPNNTMSGPCSFSIMPVPLGIAIPLATANPVRCLAEDCSWTLMPIARAGAETCEQSVIAELEPPCMSWRACDGSPLGHKITRHETGVHQ